MDIDWSSLDGVEAWAEQLDALLVNAEESAQQEAVAERLAAARLLDAFILHSPPGEAYGELDAVAGGARRSLLLATLSERLADLSVRSSRLAELRKAFREGAGELAGAARRLRLEKAKRVVDAATEAIDAAKQLRTGIDEASDEELAKRIDSAIRAVQLLRETVEAKA
jgi:hypothetical protein